MCELFGFSSKFPATVRFSLERFLKNAGDRNPDGWGIAFNASDGMRVERAVDPAPHCPLSRRLAAEGVVTDTLISHVRKATVGGVSLRNTHPFECTTGGHRHLFAFNGNVPAVLATKCPGNRCPSRGDTDAEHALCLLLALPGFAEERQPLRLAHTLRRFGMELATMGPANFLYYRDGVIYAFASRRTHHDGVHPPGLWSLQRHCRQSPPVLASAMLEVEPGAELEQQVCLLASIPLSDEPWQPLQQNELVVMQEGGLTRIVDQHEI